MFPRFVIESIAVPIIRRFTTGSMMRASHGPHIDSAKKESERMKRFHDKLKSETPYDFSRQGDPVLIDIDPQSGEFIPESEKEPTKWGDWQHGGRHRWKAVNAR